MTFLMLFLGAAIAQDTPPSPAADPASLESLLQALRATPDAVVQARAAERARIQQGMAQEIERLRAESAALAQRAAALERALAEEKAAADAESAWLAEMRKLRSAPALPAPAPGSTTPTTAVLTPAPAATPLSSPAAPAVSPTPERVATPVSASASAPAATSAATPAAAPAATPAAIPTGPPAGAPVEAPAAAPLATPAATPAEAPAAAPPAPPSAATTAAPSTPGQSTAPTAPTNASPPANPAAAPRGPRFEEDVLPLLEEHCAACHEPADRKGGLDLTTYAAAMRGGSSGSVIKPGSAAQSRLFRLVNHDEAPTMPPGGSKLPEPALNVLRAWIDQGATPDGSTVAPREPATMPQAATAKAPAMEASNAPDAAPAWPDAGSLQPTEGRPSVLRALATSPAAPLAATNGRPGEIHLHDLKTGALLGAWPFPQGRVEDLSFSRDGRRLLAIGGMPGRRGAGLVFDVTTGRLERTFGRFFDSALAGAVSPRQTLIAVAGASKVAQVFDRETGAARFAIEGHEDWITSIAISPDGNWIATGDRQGRILVHEADSGLLAHRYEGHPATIHALRYSPDAKALYSAGGDGRIVAWQADEPERLREFNVGSGAVLDLCLDADGAVLAATSVGGALTFFEAGGRALGRPLALDDDGHAIAFDAHSGQWLIAAHSGHLHRVDARTRRLVPPTATP